METSLYLFPVPPLAEPPRLERVKAVLQETGFLGPSLEPDRHLVGESFFNLVTFAGCSPHLQLEPREPGDQAFTHLRLHRTNQPELRVAPNRGRPRCPACKAPVAGWKEALPGWRPDATRVVACPECDHRCAVAELDWRRYGVAARLLVEVRRVWPGEAVPAETLLAALEAGTGCGWDYAWAEAI